MASLFDITASKHVDGVTGSSNSIYNSCKFSVSLDSFRTILVPAKREKKKLIEMKLKNVSCQTVDRHRVAVKIYQGFLLNYEIMNL